MLYFGILKSSKSTLTHIEITLLFRSFIFRTFRLDYTAGGFNSIQELKAYKEKHVAIAFNKMFDDQKFRLLNS